MNNISSSLKQIIYSSRATQKFDDLSLSELLKKSRDYNLRDGVTGILLFRNGSFMQVLEGPSNVVEQTFQRISEDTRHTSILKMYEEIITKRDFPEWTMAFNGNPGDKIVGLSDFLNPYRSKDEKRIPHGAVKVLLNRFKEINKR
ncbi:MAG: hypothetical protein ACI9O6_003043 [Glaciecola sp.]|jgi:hypothetical protein